MKTRETIFKDNSSVGFIEQSLSPVWPNWAAVPSVGKTRWFKTRGGAVDYLNRNAKSVNQSKTEPLPPHEPINP